MTVMARRRVERGRKVHLRCATSVGASSKRTWTHHEDTRASTWARQLKTRVSETPRRAEGTTYSILKDDGRVGGMGWEELLRESGKNAER